MSSDANDVKRNIDYAMKIIKKYSMDPDDVRNIEHYLSKAVREAEDIADGARKAEREVRRLKR